MFNREKVIRWLTRAKFVIAIALLFVLTALCWSLFRGLSTLSYQNHETDSTYRKFKDELYSNSVAIYEQDRLAEGIYYLITSKGSFFYHSGKNLLLHGQEYNAETLEPKNTADYGKRLASLVGVGGDMNDGARKQGFDTQALREKLARYQGQIASQQNELAAKQDIRSAYEDVGSESETATDSGDKKIVKIGYFGDGSPMTAEQKREQIKLLASKLPDTWSINYPATGEEKIKLFVFSDYTCSVCRKLHENMSKINAEGISVRYLFYPRALAAGETPQAESVMDQMAQAWCSPDPREAMDQLYQGVELKGVQCNDGEEAIIKHHFFTGTMFDLTGTPTSFSSNGDLVVGFSSVEKLKERLKM